MLSINSIKQSEMKRKLQDQQNTSTQLKDCKNNVQINQPKEQTNKTIKINLKTGGRTTELYYVNK